MKKRFLLWMAVMFLISLSSGCIWRAERNAESTLEIHPAVAAPTQAPLYTEYDCVHPPKPFQIARVVRVIDGDSIEVKIDEKLYEVRYIGINTPEFHSGERAEAIAATRANEALLFGKEVFLFKDVSETDKFDRLLRYVFTDEVFINLEMVKSGLADSRVYPPDTSCQDLFDIFSN